MDRYKRWTILHALRAGGRLGATEARILTRGFESQPR